MNVVMLATSAVSTSWKWYAVLIAAGVIILLFGAVALSANQGTGSPWKLIQGFDGVSSTSKFQWLLWLVVILFSYIALWILRAKQGDYSALPDVPKNVMLVLGFSTATMAAAKGITTAYSNTGRVQKQKPVAGAKAIGGIFQDDSGIPEIAKIQIVGFTFVALAIFLATVIHQIVSTPTVTSLPDIDASLMVLMGLSSGGYVAKKIVSVDPPNGGPPGPPGAAAVAPAGGAPAGGVAAAVAPAGGAPAG